MAEEPHGDLPLWLRVAVLAILTVLLSVNVMADIYVSSYDGQYVTIALLGVVATGIGIARGLGGRDK